MDDVYKNIEECNPNRKRKILVFPDDMTADMVSNKKPTPIATELFIISFVLITQSCFAVPTNITLNFMHYFIMK